MSGNSKRVLSMTLHRKWFDAIAKGKKKKEYRDSKDYWLKRFFDPEGRLIKYDEVHFKNGYSPEAPFMRVEWLGMKKITVEGSEVCAIQLGNVLEILNWKGPAA